MPIYTLSVTQLIPAPIEEVWNFFSMATNLEKITPKHLGFHTLSIEGGEKIFEGQLIKYRLKPLFNIPVKWTTKIALVNAPHEFVDEQLKGPYKLWHHHHFFKSIEGGVEMKDQVDYEVPFGFIGTIANKLIVESKLREIFNYRFEGAEKVFGKWPGEQVNNLVFSKRS